MPSRHDGRPGRGVLLDGEDALGRLLDRHLETGVEQQRDVGGYDGRTPLGAAGLGPDPHMDGLHTARMASTRSVDAVALAGRGDAAAPPPAAKAGSTTGALTAWMHAHLSVIAVPFDDSDTLGHLEDDVLSRLDPPMNLQGMTATPTRRRLKELRRPHGSKSKRAVAATAEGLDPH